MKNIVLLIVWCISVSACAQKQKETSLSMNVRNQNITEDNVVEEILKRVKHYEKEPQYFIRPVQNNCTYELLINDFPVYNEFSLEILATPIPINKAILKSGEQTLTVRMYPLGNLLKDNYDTGDTITTLLDNTSMKIEVVKYDAYNISHRLSDEKTVLTHYSPTKEGTKKFVGSGLPYYEYIFSFNAEVPYENEGWLNGEDLTKFNQKELEIETLKFYESYKELHKKQSLNSLVQLNYDIELRSSIAYYRDKKFLEDLWKEFKKPIYYKNKKYQSTKDYEIKLFGKNRVITLQFPRKDHVGKRLQGESSFWFLYNNGNGLRGSFFDLYLYIPKGGTLADLQTIL